MNKPKVKEISRTIFEVNNPMKNQSISKKVTNINRERGNYLKVQKRMKNGGAIKARMANQTLPNKPEKIIIKLIKQYNLNLIYVGDGKKWLKGQTQYFNPDFINKEKKVIVEFFGDYWHSLPGVIEKDKERLLTYKKYGYKTLVIWGNELKNSPKLEIVNKIKRFL